MPNPTQSTSAATPISTRILIWVAPVLIIAVAVVLIVAAQGQNGSNGADPKGTTAIPGTPRPTADPSGAGADPAGPDQSTVAGAVELYRANRGPDIARRDSGDLMAMGGIDSPVVMIVFSDYQCSYCARWVEQTQQQLIDDYVEDGKLRIEWRDANIFGDVSRKAANGAYAAAVQGQFWEFHDSLFADGQRVSEADAQTDALVARAEALGLDTKQFRSDLASTQVASAVQANEDEAAAVGAISTPAFLINGIPVSGAQPTEIFTGLIDAELAAAE